MDIQNITIGQLQQLQSILGNQSQMNAGLDFMVGKKCIIRTYSAGVWFGEVAEKSGNEVIVKNARRMWKWRAAQSISLSAVAKHGIKHDKSKIVEAVNSVWLEAIELLPCTIESIESLEGAPHVEAE